MSQPTVLLVDDEPDIRFLVSMALRKLGGLEVRAEPSGQAALTALTSGYRPDMIILDVMMPDMDGIQTLQAIRGLPDFANLPVCFLTAKIQPGEVAYLRSLGVCDVMAKPFSPAALVKQLQECWQSCARTTST